VGGRTNDSSNFLKKKEIQRVRKLKVRNPEGASGRTHQEKKNDGMNGNRWVKKRNTRTTHAVSENAESPEKKQIGGRVGETVGKSKGKQNQTMAGRDSSAWVLPSGD